MLLSHVRAVFFSVTLIATISVNASAIQCERFFKHIAFEVSSKAEMAVEEILNPVRQCQGTCYVEATTLALNYAIRRDFGPQFSADRVLVMKSQMIFRLKRFINQKKQLLRTPRFEISRFSRRDIYDYLSGGVELQPLHSVTGYNIVRAGRLSKAEIHRENKQLEAEITNDLIAVKEIQQQMIDGYFAIIPEIRNSVESALKKHGLEEEYKKTYNLIKGSEHFPHGEQAYPLQAIVILDTMVSRFNIDINIMKDRIRSFSEEEAVFREEFEKKQNALSDRVVDLVKIGQQIEIMLKPIHDKIEELLNDKIDEHVNDVLMRSALNEESSKAMGEAEYEYQPILLAMGDNRIASKYKSTDAMDKVIEAFETYGSLGISYYHHSGLYHKMHGYHLYSMPKYYLEKGIDVPEAYNSKSDGSGWHAANIVGIHLNRFAEIEYIDVQQTWGEAPGHKSITRMTWNYFLHHAQTVHALKLD